MELSVKHDIFKVLPKLEQFTSRQAPFAIAKALTATAKLVQGEVTAALPTAFDRPSAWTRKAFSMKRAEKSDLTAWVFAKDSQAKYLKPGVRGGARRVKGFEKRINAATEADDQAHAQKLVPTRNVRLDAQGNVSLATIRRIAAQANASKGGSKRYFVGQPKGDGANAGRGYGIYERTNKGKRIRALMVFAEPKGYRKRLDMPGIGARVVRREFVPQLQQAWAQAMRTAR